MPTVRNLSYRTLCPARQGLTAATAGTLFPRAPESVGDSSPRNAVQRLPLADEAGHRLRHNPHGRRGRRSRATIRWSHSTGSTPARRSSPPTKPASCASVWTLPRSVTTQAGPRCGRSNDCSTTPAPVHGRARGAQLSGWPSPVRGFSRAAEKRPAASVERRSVAPGEPVEAAISVPANASSAQRFLTLDAFTQAGFDVAALLNEPSAAGFEYAHRFRSTITAKREYVLIYDLGGGTFDASLLQMTGRLNEVVFSEGIQRLGGDDFDEAILRLVRRGAALASRPARRARSPARGVRKPQGSGRPEHPPLSRRPRRRSARRRSRSPSTTSTRPVCRWWTRRSPRCRRLARPARRRPEARRLVGCSRASTWSAGRRASRSLPAPLRTTFDEKRVKRSLHPFAATAMGLALFLDREAGFALSERLSPGTSASSARRVGGEDVVFDPILPEGSSAARRGPAASVVTAGATARRTTSATSASSSAAGYATAIPTATSRPMNRCSSRSIPTSATTRTCRAGRCGGATTAPTSRSVTSSRRVAPSR